MLFVLTSVNYLDLRRRPRNLIARRKHNARREGGRVPKGGGEVRPTRCPIETREQTTTQQRHERGRTRSRTGIRLTSAIEESQVAVDRGSSDPCLTNTRYVGLI